MTQEEYTALRATIRERGTARVCIFAAGIAAWAAATIAIAALAATPVATLLPLLVLAAVFEAVFALHIGVERIGRYIQVFHEVEPAAADAGAESGDGRMGACRDGVRPPGAAPPRPTRCSPSSSVLAAVFNLMPALILEPQRAELIFVGGAHALFALRLFVARQPAAQTARDRSRTVSAARRDNSYRNARAHMHHEDTKTRRRMTIIAFS